MTAPIRFGTLGVAKITKRALIHPADNARQVAIYAIAAREKARAESFAAHEGIRAVLDDYQGVIDHPDVNAIYNPLVISLHKLWTIKALEAGKHVLCEKSFAMNAEEAKEMAAVAKTNDLVLMDAFHYRYHPVFKRAVEIVRSGAIGKLEHVEGYFHIPVNDPGNIRMDYSLGGGVTMDIGCYPISWLRHLTGEEPRVTKAEAVVGPPNVDITLTASYEFPSGVTGTSSGDMASGATFRAELIARGSAGTLTVTNPLVPQMGHDIQVETATETTHEQLDRRPTYDYQLDAFIDAVLNQAPVLTDAEDAIKQMQVIDAVYEAAGLPRRSSKPI
ncbi:MAG: Gfo/Idh/MocA family oxidoreductase [Gammaproteobacteria bacterium]|nr:Gfo/Idh/MocA family oxidoreductase [Gammaproteobacteria bacterium]